MEKIVVIGISGQTKVIIDAIEKEGKYSIAGLLDSSMDPGYQMLGYRVIGTENDIPRIMESLDLAGGVIAEGDNWRRMKICEGIKSTAPTFKFVRVIHPSSIVANHVEIGDGTAVMAGVIVNSSAVIGEHCIINAKSSIDHDCFLDDYSSLAPNSTLAGYVKIGKFSAISMGVNIIHGITVKEQTVIGAGSLVLKDMPEHVVAFGSPARIARKREAGEKYL